MRYRERESGPLGIMMTVAVAGLAVCGCLSCERNVGSSGVLVRTVPVSDRLLSTSGWLGLVEQPPNPAPASKACAFLGTDRVAFVPKSDTHRLTVCTRDNGTVLASWAWGPEWYLHHMARSRKGEYVVVCLSEELTLTGNYRRESCRVGVVGPKERIHWVGPIAFGQSGTSPRCTVVSDDGETFAIVGPGGSDEVQVWSTKEGKMLWRDVPKGESGMEDIAFSPDGRTLYAGGTSGWVYAYEASSGRVTMRVLASRESKPVYGYRVSKVDVSPDGTLVAAGTGPDGDVYVWDTKTGKLVVVISSKGSTVSDLAFSPDSCEIVVGGGMRMALDVWRIR